MDLSKSLLHVAGSAYRMLLNEECGLTKEEENIVLRNLLYWMEGRRHFDERLGRASIANIYYFKSDTHKVYAPFFDLEDIRVEYEAAKEDISEYTFWDFAVTMNMMFANHHDIIMRMIGNNEKLVKITSIMAINFLNDEDTEHPSDKIWWYMNS